MQNVSDPKIWAQLLEEDPKLKKLAIEAGVENNPIRAQELNVCLEWDCGKGVIKSKAEEDLATYMFLKSDEDSANDALRTRMMMARKAGMDL